jgi:hypothetical protein
LDFTAPQNDKVTPSLLIETNTMAYSAEMAEDEKVQSSNSGSVTARTDGSQHHGSLGAPSSNENPDYANRSLSECHSQQPSRQYANLKADTKETSISEYKAKRW